MERAELGLPTAAAASAPSGAVDLLAGAMRILPRLGAASPLGTVVFSLCASRLDIEAGNGAWGLAAGYALMGYACRASESGGSEKAEDTAWLGAALPFTRAGDVDYERLLDRPADLATIVDRVAAIASDLELLADRAVLGRDLWTAFEAEATRRLRSHYLRRGAAPASLPAKRHVPELLRLGYALRLLDEVAGEAPAGPVRAQRDTGGNGEVPYDAEAWLTAAAAICADGLEPALDELIDAGVPCVLGRSGAWLDSDDGAMSSADARLGFSLRRYEHSARAARESSHDAFSSEATAPGRLEDLPVLVADVVRYGYCGGARAALAGVPGASRELKDAALRGWVDRRFDATPHRAVEEILALARYGYLLRRALELRGHADRAEAWATRREAHGRN